MEQKYLTVTALTKYIKRKFDMDSHLKGVWLQGEISNFNHHARGHMYFTIKDENARISSVMFASSNRSLKFKPENGMKVLLYGDVSVYERSGQYQLYVQNMEPDGVGALYLAYEQLKNKLQAEGLFSNDRKKAIPRYPMNIGIITSPTGAAIRDILTTIKRRYPMVKCTVIPVSVQGEASPQSIVNGIHKANELKMFDTLIIGRGGGSIEELWSFNEEVVARAIASSQVPIISAVGHETDFTISDWVADLRAPTPTAAAELAVPSYEELKQQATSLTHRLNQQMKQTLNTNFDKLNSLRNAYAFKFPVHLTRQKEQDLDRHVWQLTKNFRNLTDHKAHHINSMKERLKANSPKQMITEKVQQKDYLTNRLKSNMTSYHQQQTNQFQKHMEKLAILSPLETMKRGYSITYDDSNTIIKSSKQVGLGEQIKVSLIDGQISCQVLDKEERDGQDG
ncbi:exodeoxyribonuclease VII large subunit [Alkalibacillus aidingensis]|uniref:exodeoxyribonuclease VII large subunit n=1 Tax=Alkalibacillus aidingensis TaxID=2747607 RepID=UPI001660D414|nr:exodeoxyribonuclease VII large subunit [Alkalibacillus aidingensis]